MPDFSGGGDLFRSRILGMGLEDTPYQQQNVGGMLGGATPEQLQSFFGSPQVQEQFKAFGIDPQQFTQNIRQSPFLPQSFMGQHPHLGGALSHAMANVAATPEAPLVSGAGSGMSRAMQGAMGGNDMIRQFQLHQMMAPFGMMAGMMPTYGEERRRAIEEAIVKETQERMKMLPAQGQIQQEMGQARTMTAQAAEDRARAAQEAAQRPQVHFGPIGTGYTTTQDVPYSPQGGPEGLQFAPQGQGHPLTSLVGPGAGMQMPMPGWGFSPEQQAGWQTQYTPYDRAAMRGQFTAKAVGSQTPEKGDLLKSQSELNRAKAPTEKSKQEELAARAQREKAEASHPGGRYGAAREERYDKEYRAAEQHAQDEITKIQQLVAGGMDKKLGDEQIQSWKNWLATVKENTDRQKGQPGQSAAELAGRPKPGPQLSPGASPGSAQSGGPGANRSQGTAVQNPYPNR